MLAATGLSKSYHNTPVLRDVSLTLAPGEVLGLFGPNGAGKSTLMHILALITRQDAGEYELYGGDAQQNARTLRERIGFVPQDIALFEELTVRDNLFAFCRQSGAAARRKAEETAESIKLMDVYKKRVRTLSGGTKRRVNLAAALVNDPALLILDEPLVGVDILHAANILGLLKSHARGGAAIVISGHSAGQILPVCNKVMTLYDGRAVFSGTPEEFQKGFGNPEEALRSLLGAAV
jgi:ABC-2 type transport system ATP-binding protein